MWACDAGDDGVGGRGEGCDYCHRRIPPSQLSGWESPSSDSSDVPQSAGWSVCRMSAYRMSIQLW